MNNVIIDSPPLVESLADIPPTIQDAVGDLLDHLGRSVKLMVQDIPYHAYVVL